jgi:hypothetical protein
MTATARRWVAAVFTGAAWTAIVLARLFAGGAIGKGDQGDSRRLMCQLGVRALRPFGAEATKFVYTTWVPHHWYGEACGADGSGEPYRSSQLALLRLAKPLTRLLGYPGALDLRALGVLCAVIVGLAVAALVLVIPGSLAVRVVIASLVGLAAADASVAEYFISPYSEPAALLGIMVLCAALLWLWRDGESTWPRLIAVAGVAVFTMTAKTQIVALLPAVLLALLWVPYRRPAAETVGSRHRSSSPSRSGRLARLAARGPALLVCGMVVAASAVYIRATPHRFSEVNAYNQVFSEILPHGRDPVGDLRWLGVDPSLAPAATSAIFDPNSAATKVSYLQFRDKVTQAKLVQFYFSHPDRLGHLTGEGLRAMGVWRENYLGTYMPGSGHPPGAQECRVCVYSKVFSLVRHAPVFILTLWLLTLIVGTSVVRDRRLEPHERAMGRLSIILVIASVCEFWAVMLSEGVVDLYKHMIFTNFLTALCIPGFVGSVLVLWFQRGHSHAPSRTRSPAPEAAPFVPASGAFPWRTGEESAL